MLDHKDIYHYWQYCLYIEKNLEETTRFVEVCEANSSTYSAEFAQIISLACAEIDSICKLLCSAINPSIIFDNNKNKGTMLKYTPIILNRFPKLAQCELRNDKTDALIKPFYDWAVDPYSSPNWWHDYQKMKHSRHSNFKLANQENAFNSVAGLIVVNLYLYRLIRNEAYEYPDQTPRIFSAPCFSPQLACRGEELPDFQ